MEERRTFLKSLSLSAGALLFHQNILSSSREVSEAKLSCQQYTWFTYYQREGKKWMDNPTTSLNDFVKSGFPGYEPSFAKPSEVAVLQKQLDQQKLWAKSMYVNSMLHEPQLVEKNIEGILAIALEARKIGIEIIVTNPTPIKWGVQENKSDEQLKAQAIALNLLGLKLKSMDITLAYHNHDAEMREGAREFHHMLTGTDPENVKLCLDAHWIFRGAGNSQVALFDIVDLYNDRIVELHLRQSHDGIWSEVFGRGDIDYSRLAETLRKKNIKPLLVLEQAIEEGTPHTLDTVSAMRKSLNNVRNVFKDFL